MAMKKGHFKHSLFGFLEELQLNNRREWFEANRARYERDVREPMRTFISDFALRLRKISPKLIADPRPSGGSMFRIYRDVRFSPDKRPYKTNVAARFSHVMSRDVHAPGFYVHLDPSGVFCGAGIWHPDPATLASIRDFIVKHPAQWKRAINDAKFRRLCALEGDVLSRPPKGYDPGHPLIDDLKRKDFIAVTNLDLTDELSPLFIDRLTAACIAASPLMRFLTKALGLQF